MGKLGSKWGNNDLDRVRLVSNYRCVFLDSTGERALTKKRLWAYNRPSASGEICPLVWELGDCAVPSKSGNREKGGRPPDRPTKAPSPGRKLISWDHPLRVKRQRNLRSTSFQENWSVTSSRCKELQNWLHVPKPRKRGVVGNVCQSRCRQERKT